MKSGLPTLDVSNREEAEEGVGGGGGGGGEEGVAKAVVHSI